MVRSRNNLNDRCIHIIGNVRLTPTVVAPAVNAAVLINRIAVTSTKSEKLSRVGSQGTHR